MLKTGIQDERASIKPAINSLGVIIMTLNSAIERIPDVVYTHQQTIYGSVHDRTKTNPNFGTSQLQTLTEGWLKVKHRSG